MKYASTLRESGLITEVVSSFAHKTAVGS